MMCKLSTSSKNSPRLLACCAALLGLFALSTLTCAHLHTTAPWTLFFCMKCAAAGCVLLQREIPERVNGMVAARAKAAGVPLLLDLGGDDSPCPAALLEGLDYICPNETELQRISGMPTSTVPEIEAAARKLQASGVKNVLVTIGAQGSMLFRGEDEPTLRQSIFAVDHVVDTTGAGDCFRGAFARALAGQQNAQDALRLGAAAAAHCVQVKGAMISMPTYDEVAPLLGEEPPSKAAVTS